MRIFLSCQQSLRKHDVPAYAFWETYFFEGLREAGHELVFAQGVDWAEGLCPLDKQSRHRWLSATWDKTVDCLRREHRRQPVDLFLGYLFPNQVEPTAISEIRTCGVPCVNFFCDNVREFSRVPEAYRPFDLHWVPEYEAVPLYARAGLPCLHAPMPAWIPPALRTYQKEENDACVFLGSHDVLREDLLAKTVVHGIPLRIYGAGWLDSGTAPDGTRRTPRRFIDNQYDFVRRHGLRGIMMRFTYQMHRRHPDQWKSQHCHPPASGQDYIRISRESQIVLGINRYPGFRNTFKNPGRYSRLRDIEAPMLGACYLTEYAPGLEHLYDLETEIATYHDAESLAEAVNRLKAEPQTRERIRRMGQKRALSEHTISRSLEAIGKRLGIGYSGQTR